MFPHVMTTEESIKIRPRHVMTLDTSDLTHQPVWAVLCSSLPKVSIFSSHICFNHILHCTGVWDKLTKTVRTFLLIFFSFVADINF